MKTTKADFAAYKKEFLEYVDALGLKQWESEFVIQNRSDAYAWLDPCDGQQVVVGIAENRPSNMDVDRLAKHEACELLLYPLRELLYRYYSDEFIDDEVHKIVNRLMKVRLK